MTQNGMFEVDELVREIARALVDDPSAVEVASLSKDENTVLKLRVAPQDVGKVIGKQGRTARSVRTILGAVSMSCIIATRSTSWKKATSSKYGADFRHTQRVDQPEAGRCRIMGLVGSPQTPSRAQRRDLSGDPHGFSRKICRAPSALARSTQFPSCPNSRTTPCRADSSLAAQGWYCAPFCRH